MPVSLSPRVHPLSWEGKSAPVALEDAAHLSEEPFVLSARAPQVEGMGLTTEGKR